MDFKWQKKIGLSVLGYGDQYPNGKMKILVL